MPQAKFPRQLHLHPAVTYVYVSSLGCKFASLGGFAEPFGLVKSSRLRRQILPLAKFPCLRAFSTLCQSVDFVNILRPPRSRAAVCSCCRRDAGWLTPGRSVVLAAMRPANARVAGARRYLPHLSGLPCQYHRRVVGAKFTTSAALAHPRATGRRPRLLHLSGSPLVSTIGAWSGRNLPPRQSSLVQE